MEFLGSVKGKKKNEYIQQELWIFNLNYVILKCGREGKFCKFLTANINL